MVKDIRPGSAGSAADNFPGNLKYVDDNRIININGMALFATDDGIHGNELWRSDGTAAGTYLVKDINPGQDGSGSSRNSFTGINGIAYFAAYDGIHGMELWRSDGTTAGTYLVKDINPGGDGSVIFNITDLNGTAYFWANDEVHGNELWRSDGTTAGTYLVKDINPGMPSSKPSQFTTLNGTIYFSADDGIHGNELWRSDGTAAGTYLVKDIGPGAYNYNLSDLASVNGMVYFWANDGVHGSELWCSDGTTAGTYLVKDIYPGPQLAHNSGYQDRGGFISTNGIAYFYADDGVYGGELWRSDGTAAGTYLVKDIYLGIASSSPYVLASVNGIAYFRVDDGVHGAELWRSDGTTAGTYLVKDINPGQYSSAAGHYGFVSISGIAYFAAYDGVHGLELWRSDGTAAGTYLVKDINPGTTSGYSKSIINVNGTAYFWADDGVHGSELWRYGGIITQHFHQLAQNPSFQTRKPLAEGNNFKLCADGAEASVFKLSGSNNDYSQAIMKIAGTDISQTGSFSVVQQSKDSLVVRYKHPDFIQTAAASTTLVVSVYSTPSATQPLTTFNLIVYRAPVLMVHGLWSGSESFAKLENELNLSGNYPSANFFRRADYSTTNSLAFVFNVPKIKTELELLIKRLVDDGVSAGNVDYIGHSMGGVLGRLYLQGETYQCGFHKLITLNTPHSGSQLANFLVKAQRSIPKTAGILCSTLIPLASFAMGEACNGGGLSNLQVDSPEITQTLNGVRCNFRTVPTHTIATVEYQTANEIKEKFFGEGAPVPENPNVYRPVRKKIEKALGTAGKAKDIIALVDITASLFTDVVMNELFDGPSDNVVSLVSQRGGLSGNCSTTIDNQLHTGSPENDQVIARLQALLLEKPSSTSFCANFNPLPLGSSTPALTPPNGAIAINSPRRGQVLQPGATGVITASGTNVTQINTLVEYSSTEIVVAKAVGTSTICNIPVGSEVGPRRVIVTGRTATGGYVADTTYFVVGTVVSTTCQSLQSGKWSTSSTWSCGHVPTLNDNVIIGGQHTVLLDGSMPAAQCLNLEVLGTFSMQGGAVTINGTRITVSENDVISKP